MLEDTDLLRAKSMINNFKSFKSKAKDELVSVEKNILKLDDI